MITARTLRRVPRSGMEWDEAERIKTRLRILAVRRQPYYLKREDMDLILAYKLRGQLLRTASRRLGWTDEHVAEVTRSAFSISLDDRQLELRARTAVLTALPGVGVPVASAVLALTAPGIYGIIDVRNWRQIFGTARRTFSVDDYATYMRVIWRLAEELSWDAQVVDWCIWRYNQES